MITLKRLAFVVIFFASCARVGQDSNDGSATDNSNLPQEKDSAAVVFPRHWPTKFGFGVIANEADIQAIDIDVMPDGTGLPQGSGTVAQGSAIFKAKCAICHGPTGKEGPFDKLAGREPREGFPFGKARKYRSMHTIGNYWPYATTIFDYVKRAMPQTDPGSLSDNEIYAITAYLLYLNEIVPEDAVMNAQSLPQVVMPARDRFVVDNRKGGVEIR